MSEGKQVYMKLHPMDLYLVSKMAKSEHVSNWKAICPLSNFDLLCPKNIWENCMSEYNYHNSISIFFYQEKYNLLSEDEKPKNSENTV